jgi:hypothetical protein
MKTMIQKRKNHSHHINQKNHGSDKISVGATPTDRELPL